MSRCPHLPAARNSSIRRRKLVTFRRPPVAEVALTVQFSEPVVDWLVLAEFTVRTRSELPQTSQQPALPRIDETFDVVPGLPPFQITFEPQPPLPRTWFISGDGALLVQVQADRMSLNWRRTSHDAAYPRYDDLRSRFDAHLDTLFACIAGAGRDAPSIDVCEVAYVNPVEVPGRHRGPGHPDLAKVVNRLRPPRRDAFLPPAEDAQYQARFRIPSSSGGDAPCGRLTVSAAPTLEQASSQPIYMVQLLARVLPDSGDVAAAGEALDRGHEWVVLGFKDVTTPAMHEIWGLMEKRTTR